MSTETQPRASLGVKKKDVPGVTRRAQTMHDSMTAAAATFASPPTTMAAFLLLITALALAQQTATGTRARGSAKARNAKRNALWTAMNGLLQYVQGLANALDPASAAALIELAGLVVAATPKRHKEILAATLTETPGTVHLEANASVLVGPAARSKKVTWNWQSSSDGKTWNDLHATPYANTDVPGLTLMTTYSFRVSVTIGKVTGAWSQAVTLLVH